jgi:uncharacterized YccA/Bax inhibitor family protein
MLNEKTFSKEKAYSTDEMSAGWAAGAMTAGAPSPSASTTGVMTINGTVARTLILLALLVVAGGFGWSQVTVTGTNFTMTPMGSFLLVGGVIGGLVLALITAFVPKAAPITAPLYALAQGSVVGLISGIFEAQYPGIVLQAVAASIGVFLVMLLLYTSRTIRVTPKLQKGIIAATLGVFVAYLGIFLASFFTNSVELFSGGPVGIIFSLIVAGVAAFNLLLDFSFVEEGAQAQAPKYFSWYCAFGIMVTLVWLYLTILRLLAMLRR